MRQEHGLSRYGTSLKSQLPQLAGNGHPLTFFFRIGLRNGRLAENLMVGATAKCDDIRLLRDGPQLAGKLIAELVESSEITM
jgi:hypothetical protein